MSKRRKKKADMIKILWVIFIVVLFLVIAAELLMHRHAHFALDGIPLFDAWFGFGSCVAIVLFSKLLGFFVKAPENYYDKGKKQ